VLLISRADFTSIEYGSLEKIFVGNDKHIEKMNADVINERFDFIVNFNSIDIP